MQNPNPADSDFSWLCHISICFALHMSVAGCPVKDVGGSKSSV